MRNIEIGVGCPDNEVALVGRLQVGSEEAFATLVQLYQDPIFNIAYRVLGDPVEASDAVQETFMKIYRGIQQFRGQSSLKTWIYKIAMTECLNRNRWWKRWKHYVPVSLDEPIHFNQDFTLETHEYADSRPTPEAHCVHRETEALVQAALEKLSVEFRIVVVLRDIEGLSYEEIADALKISLGTVKSRLWRGRFELKSLLQELLDKPR